FVHLVDALVAQVAVAVVPGPVPVVVQVLALERILRGGTAPQIVIDALGNRLLAVDLADRAARLVAEAAGDADLAELAGTDVFHRLPHAGHRAALRAGLANLFVLAGRLDDPPAFADVMADRLFHVDVLAGLQGPDGRQGVPVIGRGDGDDIDILVFDHSAQVLLEFGRHALGLLDELDGVLGKG